MSGWRFLPEGTEALAPDERALWQGRPTPQGLARRFFHIRLVAGYFVVLAAWNLVSAHADGMRVPDAVLISAWTAIPAVCTLAVLYAMAWVLSSTTHYMITERRIIMQIGVALPIALSLPLRSVGSADVKVYPDGSGDVTVAFSGDDRLAYLLLWPHVRPRRYKKAEPMLRSVRDARAVAETLAKALVAVSVEPCVAPQLDAVRAPRQPEPAMAVA